MARSNLGWRAVLLIRGILPGACVGIAALVLSGCGKPLDAPRQICAEQGPEKVAFSRIGSTVYRDCIRYEIGCLKPLKLEESITGALICRLPKEGEGN